MVLVVLWFLAWFLASTHSDEQCGWYMDLRYRRTLSIPSDRAASPTLHNEETLHLNTFDLSSLAKIQPDCSDFVFGLVNIDTGVVERVLSWWTETACPSPSSSEPYTTFWLDLPSSFNNVTHQVEIFYGVSGPSFDGSASGRLLWNTNFHLGEIRLHVGTSCPNGWDSVQEWSGYFPVLVDPATDTTVNENDIGVVSDLELGRHVHSIKNTSLRCPEDQTIGATEVDPACWFLEDPWAVEATHGHIGLSGNSDGWSGQEYILSGGSDLASEYEPLSFTLLACSSGLGYRTDFHTGVVGIHQRQTFGTEWSYLSESNGLYLRFGAGLGLQSQQFADHTHVDLSEYSPNSWITSISSKYEEECDQNGAGLVQVQGELHTHVISDLGTLESEETPVVPSHVSAHFYELVNTAPLAGLNSWPGVVAGTVALFSGSIPPLGFEIETASTKGILRGFSEGFPEVSFASPVASLGHRHPIVGVLVDTYFGATEGVDTDSACSDGDWGLVLSASTHHGHLSCTGWSERSNGGDLPNHNVPLVFAWRYDIAQRPIVVNDDEVEFVIVPENVDACAPASTGFGNLGYVIGGVVGGFVGLVLLIILLVVIIVVGVVCCRTCVRKKNDGKNGMLKGESIELGTLTASDGTERKGSTGHGHGGRKSIPKGSATNTVPGQPRVSMTVNKDLFTIEFEDVELLREVGRGGGGATVYEAKWMGRTIAFKQFAENQFDQSSADSFAEFEKEVTLASTFYGCCLGRRLGIAMEFCPNGELGIYVKTRQHDGDPLSLKRKIELMLDICHGMTYLHSKMIIHRDLKPGNVMLDENVCSVVCFHFFHFGTPIYMAPEIVLGRQYSFPIDVFSFSIMMYEIVTERWNPYGIQAESSGSLEFRVANDATCRPDLAHVDQPNLKDLFSRMWHHDPDTRPSFVQIAKELSNRNLLNRRREQWQEKIL